MKTHAFLFVLMITFLTSGVVGQTSFFGVPDSSAATGSGNVIPFGDGTPTTWKNQRYQSLALKTYLPGKPGLLRSIAFAPTGSGTYKFGAMVIRVGHNTSGVLSQTYNSSFSTPPITLLNSTNLDWQVTADTWSPIPLSPKPFIYNGKDNLVIEVVSLGSHLNPKKSFHTGNVPRSYIFNFTLPAYSTKYSNGCKGSNNKEPQLVDESFPFIGTDLFRVGLTDAIASTGAFYILGTSRTKFGALTLPFSLGVIGATGCFLNCRMTVIMPAVTTSSIMGTAMVNIALPGDAVLEGVNIYGQWLIGDPKANSAGIVTTRGLESKLTQVQATRSGFSNHALKVLLGFI